MRFWDFTIYVILLEELPVSLDAAYILCRNFSSKILLQILAKSRIKKICLMANLKALANPALAKIHYAFWWLI